MSPDPAIILFCAETPETLKLHRSKIQPLFEVIIL
jgi:hypothetical protein